MKFNQKGQEFEVLPFFLFAKEKSSSCNLIPKGIKCTLKSKDFSSAQKRKTVLRVIE